ncbi:MAG: ATP-dependent DNA helicase RecG [bacterium]|nr:ATP-dependent DNA helicase RecG [bacterium]
MQLSTSLEKVLKTKKDYIEQLNDMGLHTVEDLLLYIPRGYEDLSEMHTFATAPINTKVTVMCMIDRMKLIRTRSRKQIVTAQCIDSEGGIAEAIWFNQPHIMRMLSDGEEAVLTGKVVENGKKLQIQSPTFEPSLSNERVHSGRLVAIYPQHDIITSKWLREKMSLLKNAVSLLPETLPKEVIDDEGVLSRSETIRILHFPSEGDSIDDAKKRLAFEDMYNVQCKALQEKEEWKGETQERLVIPLKPELIKSFFASLKFTPTDSQKISIYEILKDMEQNRSMSRLLEGDVGSGKTLVATAVMANTIASGGQCALMVPTEVLARQHVQSIGNMLINFHNFLVSGGQGQTTSRVPRVALLTGSVPKKQAQEIKERLAVGDIDLVIGTHALIEDSVSFENLSLVIVDEQHRFGVVQRNRLKEKGSPHFLAMTATPIPRTLALTAFGHHDLSVLLEKPGNRQPIDTKVVSPKDRKTVEGFIEHQISQGRQAFVICPLIQASESEDMLEIRSVKEEHIRLTEAFPSRRIALLHGKMTPSDKEDTMRAYKNREYDILVSTSVIEVGIDVPNATIMIMEGSERFGLAQLHQFRGRVGRGDFKSYCFLFTTTPEQARSQRLRAMEKHDNGFELAEIDLQIRGPGELYGTRQSGIPEIRLSSLLNPELVVRARRAAEKFLNKVV